MNRFIEYKIEEITKEFGDWAILQKNDIWYIEMFKTLYISDLSTNLTESKTIRDKIYWIKRCTKSFEEKFKSKMPEELSKKIFVLESLMSFKQ